MTHQDLSAAVHALGIQYGSHDTHTSECISGRRGTTDAPYYFAQVWFSREGDGDCVSCIADSAEEALEKIHAGLLDRRGLFSRIDLSKPMHPLARHAALLMAAEMEVA